jgi:hypothetical protein
MRPVHLARAATAHLGLLRRLSACVAQDGARPWHCRELHNPWSRAAARVDAWGILDLCMTLGRMSAVADLIGDDVILFDSALMPDRWDDAGQGPSGFPVIPVAGLTILCAFGESQSPLYVEFASGDAAIQLAPGDLALIPAAISWGISDQAQPDVFAARYFPGSARYIRDPGSPQQRTLMERLPLFNFANMPIWLVTGADRAGNDFVTGFNPRPPYWNAPPDLFTL